MDESGTVDLPLRATQLNLPLYATQGELSRLRELSENQWDLKPSQWRDTQLVRLALASALEARLLHVQRDRLYAFGLRRDPNGVTFRQLAALWRSHQGTAGQAFELAVADAVERRVPEVVQPIAEGLRLLNIADADQFQMVVLGLEKVPADQAERFYTDLGRLLPNEARMRTGKPGRPAKLGTVLERLASSSWTSMRVENPFARSGLSGRVERAERHLSQLGRADALLFTPSTVVPASLKIRCAAVERYGWKDVPMWISTARLPGRAQTRRVPGTHPLVSVELCPGQWVRHFEMALDVLDEALEFADLGKSARRGSMISLLYSPRDHLVRMLRLRSNQSIAEIVHQLRAVEPGVLDLFQAQTEATRVSAKVPLLGAKPLVNAWREDAAGAAVVVGQQHLFFKSPGVGVNPARQ